MIEKYRSQHLPESARMTSNFFFLSLREICMTTFCLLSWMVPLSSQLKNLIEAVVATTRSLHKFYGVFFYSSGSGRCRLFCLYQLQPPSNIGRLGINCHCIGSAICHRKGSTLHLYKRILFFRRKGADFKMKIFL